MNNIYITRMYDKDSINAYSYNVGTCELKDKMVSNTKILKIKIKSYREAVAWVKKRYKNIKLVLKEKSPDKEVSFSAFKLK